MGNVSSARLHFENSKRVSSDYFKTLKPQRLPERGDILYSAVGATLGVPAVVNTNEPFCFQRHVAIHFEAESQTNGESIHLAYAAFADGFREGLDFDNRLGTTNSSASRNS